jgi:ABC-type multidrug transport system fused ATPase/permease subunit
MKIFGLKDRVIAIQLIELGRKLAVNNLITLILFCVILIIDGLLIALVATSIAPIADYFLDPSFANPSPITAIFIAYLSWIEIKLDLSIVLFVFVLANTFKACSAIILHFYSRRLAYMMVHDLSRDGLFAFLSSSLQFFHSHPLGTLLNTLQRESEKLGDGILSALTLAATILQLSMLAFVVWTLSSSMILVCSLLVTIFAVVTRGLNARIVHFSSQTSSTSNEVTQSLIETLMGAKIILSSGRGSTMLARYSQAYARHSHAAVISQTLQNGAPALYQAFGFFAVSLALYVSITNGENLPTLVSALWTLMRMVPLSSQFLGGIAHIANILPSFRQYSTVLAAASDYSIKPGSQKFLRFQEGIRMEDVCYEYPQRAQALSGINLYIPKGSFTAFVGESGSGKTTTADILLRLLAPHSGSVTIDNVPLQDYDATSFFERVGYVPQESFLFNCSIRDNLLWSVPTVSDKEIWDALRMSNIEPFVSGLTHKMDTMVGDRGVALSGGQRQRIALARALIKKPDILILDEATSALDSESENLIMQAIDAISPYTTIVVIAHRLSTIARANLVYVFSKGLVVEYGSYEHLRNLPSSRLSQLILAQQLG